MPLELQIKIKSNPNYIKYLREHSNWYKILIRQPNMFKKFEEEVKETYRLRTTDKISDALSTFEMIQNILTSLK